MYQTGGDFDLSVKFSMENSDGKTYWSINHRQFLQNQNNIKEDEINLYMQAAVNIMFK